MEMKIKISTDSVLKIKKNIIPLTYIQNEIKKRK